MRWFLIFALFCSVSIGCSSESYKEPSAGARKVLTVNGVEFVFCYCPAGEFMMGSPENESDHKDNEQHKVRLTKGFWLLETEVTQEMWESVMGTTLEEQNQKSDMNGFKGVGPKCPMYHVNWNESKEFCEKLSAELGREIKLPTEAQWEYACRAGTTEAYAGDLDSMGWYLDNSDRKTHKVGQKNPNAWGLYDMHGNVMEWCSDCWDEEYYAESPVRDPENTSSSSTRRVNRGGCWFVGAEMCQSACRNGSESDIRCNFLGLRVLLVPSSRE